MGGAIYWTAREFAVKPDWDGGATSPGGKRDSFHRKGLISYDGKIKPAFNAAKDAFEATPLYRDDPAAVARAELAGGGSFVMRALLFIGVFGCDRRADRARRLVPARHLARLAPARRGPGRRAAHAARGVGRYGQRRPRCTT